jgi:hypothetical protein
VALVVCVAGAAVASQAEVRLAYVQGQPDRRAQTTLPVPVLSALIDWTGEIVQRNPDGVCLALSAVGAGRIVVTRAVARVMIRGDAKLRFEGRPLERTKAREALASLEAVLSDGTDPDLMTVVVPPPQTAAGAALKARWTALEATIAKACDHRGGRP